ncbi:SprB repeat-containing protein [bacterium SCSIO 12741]|nr:SprB repeat-containing protein [bacterium SCSIO 12741]
MRNCYKFFSRFAAVVILFLSLVFSAQEAHATHIAGGDITYKALNDTDYIITLTIYRDCRGVGVTNSPRSIRIFELCSNNGAGTSWNSPYATVSLPLTNPGGTEVSQLCKYAIDSSFCSSTPSKRKYQGMEKFIYEDTVVLPFKCNAWYIGHSFFARNSAQNANAANRNFYTQATIFTDNRDSNSSPIFTADPTPYFCLGNPATYNYAVVENDGDSMVFQLVPTESAYGTALSYIFPYSATNPLDATNFNANTGQLSFTPTTSGRFIVAMQITEYDRATKKKVGEVRRDVQFFIDPCQSNSNPVMVTGGVYNITGGSKVDSLTINTLRSATLVYDLSFSDANSGDTLTTTTNSAIALSGSTSNNKGVNPDTTTITWNPGVTATNNKYTVTYFSEDDNCPVSAATSVAVDIVLIDSLTSASIVGVKESCNNSQDGTLTAEHSGGIGPFGYVWYKQGLKITDNTKTITGISAGVSYSVTVIDLFNNDSVQTPGFNLAATLPVEIVNSSVTDIDCDGGCTGEINITGVVGGNTTVPGANGYQYTWSGTTNTTANPTNLCGGVHLVTVTDDNGCDTIGRFVINQPYAFNAQMNDSTDVSCQGGSDGAAAVKMIVTECGTTTDPCNSTTLDTVGTGTTGHDGISLPSPYATTNNVKQQYLFRKSELNAAGITGGTKISSLGFFITNWNFQTQTKQFSIAMGCTSSDTLSSTEFEDGLFEVYSSTSESYSFTNSNNWKNHTFSNSFVWDGDSNLVVEICFKNDNANAIHLSPSVQTTTTAYRSAHWYTSGTEDACVKDTVIGSAFSRPNIRLGWCLPEPSFVWSPSGGTDSVATGLMAGTYKVVVTSESGCKDSATVTLSQPATGVNASQTLIQDVVCAGVANGSVSVQATGGTAPYSFAWPAGVLTPVHDSVATNLQGGVTYTVTVTDDNGCTDTEVITLSDPDPMTFGASTISHVQCNGGNDGSITVVVSGGTAPITNYAWSHGPNGAGFNTVNTLTAANYTVTVTDNAGCTEDTTFAVTEPANPLSVTVNITQHVTCLNGSDGTAQAVPSGGTGPYSYAWSKGNAGATDDLRIGLNAGTVTVTVTDNNGCTTTGSNTVNQPATGIAISFTSQTNVLCKGDNTGEAIITPTGGTPGYTYNWDAGNPGTRDSIRVDLGAGKVRVTVTDNQGCTGIDSTTITEPATRLSASFTSTTNPLCNGQTNGEAIVTQVAVHQDTPTPGVEERQEPEIVSVMPELEP